MTILKTTPSLPTGPIHIEKDYYEQWGLKYKIVVLPPEAKPAHHLTSKYVEFFCRPEGCCGGFHREKVWTCIRCDFKSFSVDDLRKNNGCNMFANQDTQGMLRNARF